jgi:ParB/RepB/Spo0J family partition protein
MKTIKTIPLQKIDVLDETFSVNFMPDLRRLRSSMEEMGLIQPVFLREKLDRYQIVSGFRRISVIKQLGNTEIEARVFEEREMDDFRFFSLYLHENLTTRGFNTVEKAIALDKLIHRFKIDPTIVVKTFLPLFSLETNEKILKTYLSLSQMEEEVKRYVIKEEVSRSNIRKFSALTPEDRFAVLPLISTLKLSENRLREILTLLEEISKRDQLKVREIVDRKELQSILSQRELTPSQRTEKVKKVLMDFRYPKMRQLEENFEKKRKDLSLPSGILLRHQPYFEGKGMGIEFQFETVEEYRSILSSLSLLADKEEFEEMVSVI